MRPAAKSMSVRAGWLGVCTEECQLSPCRMVYIIVILDSVSLAVCLWCYGNCQFIFGSLQLDYCGAASHCVELYTLCIYLAARLCAISGLLMFCLVVGSQMIEAYNYSSVGLTKV